MPNSKRGPDSLRSNFEDDFRTKSPEIGHERDALVVFAIMKSIGRRAAKKERASRRHVSEE